jgi:hypothetical protein
MKILRHNLSFSFYIRPACRSRDTADRRAQACTPAIEPPPPAQPSLHSMQPQVRGLIHIQGNRNGATRSERDAHTCGGIVQQREVVDVVDVGAPLEDTVSRDESDALPIAAEGEEHILSTPLAPR